MVKNDVVNNAGNIFKLLTDKGDLSIREIGDLTHSKDKVIFMALGWLLNENKVRLFDKNGSLCAKANNPELTSSLSEIYY
ncbi:winged helix-turn-helix domain-containing protein [Dysgonomonas sp. Marseille-P4677]|uniref:winged helix-turn-helix domain-containing protein n=1 Tax=Dysgonomonas sp. Marseille-P4677 TaxID=2364790 RepID=UPI0019123863|nr:winged helix-turn-helix domain-containing protein [Dysgonomonas sp. Marseille-P4677]MBK5719618.1 winged helix-turn-helix domain-containing protein [Dysgonomonas sp. Marseille-P4677]